MAESIVEVTAGSGTKLHSWSKTIGANTVHDEFTLPGEYPYASYTVSALAISIATAADHVLQIMAGSSLNVRIRRIVIDQHNNATSASIGRFQILRLTTAGTGGSAVTPALLDPSDSAAGATAMTLPSSKGTESTVLRQTTMNLRQAVSATSTQIDDLFEWTQLPNVKPIIIAAGTSNGIAIKMIDGIAGAAVNIYVEIVETNF